MTENMHTGEISNRMLYDLIRDMRGDISGIRDEISVMKADINNRFNVMDGRFNEIDNRFNAMDNRFDKLEGKVEKNSERLDAVYHKRDNIQVTFSTLFAGIILFLSALLSYLVAVFTGHYVVKQ